MRKLITRLFLTFIVFFSGDTYANDCAVRGHVELSDKLKKNLASYNVIVSLGMSAEATVDDNGRYCFR